jgi:hypothetical protein
VEWIVPVVDALRGVGDEQHRAHGQVVLGVHQATGLAEVGQRRAGAVVRGDERRQVRENPSEPVGRYGKRRLVHHAGHGTGGAQGHRSGRTRAQSGEEPAPPDRRTGP